MLTVLTGLAADLRRSLGEIVVLVTGPTLLGAAMVTGVPNPWRAVAAALFFSTCPGLAVLAPVRLRIDVEIALVVPTSLAVTSLVSLAMFYSATWTASRAVAALAVACGLGALVTWLRWTDDSGGVAVPSSESEVTT